MRSRGKHKTILQYATIFVFSCTGLLSATVVSGDAYQDATKEAERESPHQRELQERSGSSSDAALEEAERESPHQRELQERSTSPYEKALQENQRERP